MSGDLNAQDVPSHQPKSRIPQRLSPGRQRWQFKPKGNTNVEIMKRFEHTTAPTSRLSSKNPTRPRSAEQNRPNSANKTKEEVIQIQPMLRTPRLEREKFLLAQKKVLQQTTRRNTNERQKDVPTSNKITRPIITVPKQKFPRTAHTNRTSSILPDQETIKRCEELEAHDKFGDNSTLQGSNNNFSDNDEESITTRSEKLVQLKMNWQEKIVQFEKMKNELNDRQNTILQVYASLRGTHQQLANLGQKASLPTTEDLKVMNVAKMTPAQLLQLCEESKRSKDDHVIIKDSLMIDMNKLNNIPMKLVETSEQILTQQKQFTNWFQNIINQEKECSIRTLSQKINEFNAENEMLNSLLHISQKEFLKEISDTMEFLRKCVNETVSCQLRNEKLTYELSELNSKVTDLRKQLINAEHHKSYKNKFKIEELEKELKEEKIKCKSLRERLTRSDGQVKMEGERAANLEAALNQSRFHTRNLERTVLQLKEQNEKLQSDFDSELNKLNESIKENSTHLEGIADDREKLQLEKEDLEKRLEELSYNYNESLSKLRHELNSKVTQLIETEKNNIVESEEKKKLQEIVESQCAKLIEAELRHKDLSKKLHEYEVLIDKSHERESTLESVEQELQNAKGEIEQYKQRLLEQLHIMNEIEMKFKESRTLEEKMKNDLKSKDGYISTLEKKQTNLEHQLKESESKMESYEEQLSSLKKHILQLKECFGDYENISELREKLNQQKDKVQVITRENIELAQTLEKRNIDLELHLEKEAKQEHDIKQRDDIIKVLSQKEEEQANIIKLLRNNLENRSVVDSNLSRQILQKNEEIKVLINNLETRKDQISQLEKIILTLEDQKHKASHQKRKDSEKIKMLEQKLEDYKIYLETRNNHEAPSKNLDSLFEILEDELGNSFEQQYKTRDYSENKQIRHIIGDRNNHVDYHAKLQHQLHPSEHENDQNNTFGGDFVQNSLDSKNQYKRDHLNRKKTNTHVETLQWATDCSRNSFAVPSGTENNSFITPIKETTKEKLPKEKYITRNLQLLVPDHFKNDRKYKMLKLASHRQETH